MKLESLQCQKPTEPFSEKIFLGEKADKLLPKRVHSIALYNFAKTTCIPVSDCSFL